MKHLLLPILMLHSAMTFAADTLSIQTPRAATIEVVADFPTGPGPFITVILAPGQGYHMNLPAIESTARRLVEEGIAVYRFNWAYYSASPRGNPSDGFELEIEDMHSVVEFARSDTRVDSSRLWAAGKSLGSSVAWHVLRGDSELRGGVLLTPVCSQVENPQQPPVAVHDYYYPDVSAETRPLIIVLGDDDPLCSTSILYSLVAKLNAVTRLSIVGGDHSFDNLHREGDLAFQQNLQAVTDFVALSVSDFSAE